MAAQDFSSSRIIQQLRDVSLLFVIANDANKISSHPVSQTVCCFNNIIMIIIRSMAIFSFYNY